MNVPLLPIILYGGMVMSTLGQLKLESDVLPTSTSNLTVTFVGHGTLMFGFDGKTIHVDPYGRLADYAALQKKLDTAQKWLDGLNEEQPVEAQQGRMGMGGGMRFGGRRPAADGENRRNNQPAEVF